MSAASHPDAGAPADEQALVTALAEVVLEETAPEELAVLPETAQEYFRDPDAALATPAGEEAVGFGLELTLLTPVVLAVLRPVVRFLVSTVGDAVQDELRSSVTALVRRLFRRPAETAADPAGGPGLTREQGQKIHDIALEQARALGVEAPQAELLADAVVGGLVVDPA